ncbi:MAG: hypothetical protein Q9207_001401 [Kuettlingeria erythrocarpa]
MASSRHTDPHDLQRQASGISTNPSAFSRAFLGLSLSKHTVASPEQVRGALGLNLLSAPNDPLVDLVFIHGLGGGSRKTWSKSSNPASFWPKEWLSKDQEFGDIRIHSFGYDSEWSSRSGSILGIHDFGRDFLAALQASPIIRRSQKAYLLAQLDPAFHELGKRLHAMLFLATPHNGANSAHFLKRILQATHSGSHPYLDDLQKDSPATQEINDEFRHCAGNLQLYSFFETKAMSFGKFTDAIIVKKSSATMGLPGERTAHLDADHRGVCKFDSPEDPNYVTVKNAFVEVLDSIRINRRSTATKKRGRH